VHGALRAAYAAAAPGIVAESPQDLHEQIRGLEAESPVFLRSKKRRLWEFLKISLKVNGPPADALTRVEGFFHACGKNFFFPYHYLYRLFKVRHE
jgi:hypothetical protein